MGNILHYLSTLKDKRRKQGLRYPLDKTLAMMLLGTMAGCVGYRSVARFCKNQEGLLTKAFDLKHGVPSHVSLTAIIEGVDLEAFQKALHQWAMSKYAVSGAEDKVIALDAKSIKGSVEAGTSQEQNFIAFVHAFCVDQQLVVGALAYENKEEGETQVTRRLIELLGIQQGVFTLDARHDSKKHWRR